MRKNSEKLHLKIAFRDLKLKHKHAFCLCNFLLYQQAKASQKKEKKYIQNREKGCISQVRFTITTTILSYQIIKLEKYIKCK